MEIKLEVFLPPPSEEQASFDGQRKFPMQGTALFPGAGMFDMACLAAQTLLPKEFAASTGLLGASIASPFPMKEGSLAVLSCVVDSRSGRVEVKSQPDSSSVARVHLTASYGERLLMIDLASVKDHSVAVTN